MPQRIARSGHDLDLITDGRPDWGKLLRLLLPLLRLCGDGRDEKPHQYGKEAQTLHDRDRKRPKEHEDERPSIVQERNESARRLDYFPGYHRRRQRLERYRLHSSPPVLGAPPGGHT